MSICPVLREECIRERCSWWYQGHHRETNKCSIPLLKLHLSAATLEIQNVNKEIINVYNELVDIENKLCR